MGPIAIPLIDQGGINPGLYTDLTGIALLGGLSWVMLPWCAARP